jgi:predicted ArsR family transcriptional regulator
MDSKDLKVQCERHINELKKTHLMYIKQQIAMLNAMKEKFGDNVIELAQEVFCDHSFKPYLSIIEKNEDRSVDKIVEILWLPLKQMGFNFSIKKLDKGIQVTCTKCPWAMLYKACNGEEWGYNLVCKADSEFVNLFNSDIKFERTRTLMQGHDYCNHTYILE